VVGSSVGSVVGALYAAGLRAEELERHGERMSSNTLRAWVFPKLGFFGGNSIARFVHDADLGNPLDAPYQGFSILTRRLALEERARADLVIEPRLEGFPRAHVTGDD
jgi:hypothetical protein